MSMRSSSNVLVFFQLILDDFGYTSLEHQRPMRHLPVAGIGRMTILAGRGAV